MSSPANPYRGSVVVFATMHGKQHSAERAFRSVLDGRIITPHGIDTDVFGTFTGDVPRTRSPQCAAFDKAVLGITLTGRPYALASEGTYRSLFGVLADHHEILLFHDSERNVTITENTIVPATGYGGRMVSSLKEAQAAGRVFGFPATHAVARAETPSGTVIRKDLTTRHALEAAVSELLTHSAQVLVEADYRAHANPARRRVIRGLAWRMARRLARACPTCGTHGWGVVDVERGAPCSLCGRASRGIVADVMGCAACPRRDRLARGAPYVSPEWCDACNP